MNFHAIMEVPKGDKHPQFPNVPEIESFAGSELDRKLVVLQRSFGIAGTPFVVPPGTPADRVEMLQEGFRKTYSDPAFFKEYKSSPVMNRHHCCRKRMRRRCGRFHASPRLSRCLKTSSAPAPYRRADRNGRHFLTLPFAHRSPIAATAAVARSAKRPRLSCAIRCRQ